MSLTSPLIIQNFSCNGDIEQSGGFLMMCSSLKLHISHAIALSGISEANLNASSVRRRRYGLLTAFPPFMLESTLALLCV